MESFPLFSEPLRLFYTEVDSQTFSDPELQTEIHFASSMLPLTSFMLAILFLLFIRKDDSIRFEFNNCFFN